MASNKLFRIETTESRKGSVLFTIYRAGRGPLRFLHDLPEGNCIPVEGSSFEVEWDDFKTEENVDHQDMREPGVQETMESK